MKKQYFGDERDFVKYSILRHLLDHDLSCTVCWMMTPDDYTKQGSQKRYLEKPAEFRRFDHKVFDYLKEQLDSPSPDIHSMKRSGPIARCRFYWDHFPPDPTSQSYSAERRCYFTGCLDEAGDTNVVFLDADIGPEPTGYKPVNWEKYVLWDEIIRFFDAGHSVMVFNYLPWDTRQRDRVVAERCELLQRKLPGAYVTAIRTKVLAFYFVVHEAHRKGVSNALAKVVRDWKDFPLWEV